MKDKIVEALIRWIDKSIRFLLYVLIFWIPYSSAVIETCVILSLLLWITKRCILIYVGLKKESSLTAKLLFALKGLRPVRSALDWPIFIFVCVCSVSVFKSDYFAQSLPNFLTKTIEWFVIYYLVREFITEKRHLWIVLGVFIFTSFSVAVDGFVQYYVTKVDIFRHRTLDAGWRATASFLKANSLGAYLTIVVPIYYSILFKQWRSRKYYFTAFLIAIVCMSIFLLRLSFSRGAWLALVLSMLVSIILLVSYRLNSKKVLVSGVLITFVSLTILTYLITSQRINTEMFKGRTPGSWRIEAWKDTTKMIKEKPFFGHGINTFMPLFQDYRRKRKELWWGKTVVYTNYWPTYAHNCYLQLTAETGILGLLGFLSILFVYFKRTIKTVVIGLRHENPLSWISLGLMTGVFAFLIHAFFDTNFYSLQLSSYLWYMIGIQMSINLLIQEDEGVKNAKE